MSDMLRTWGIEVYTPYAAANLDRARPDLVIIGNVIRRINIEATAVRDRGLITASGLGAVEFAREIFAELGVFPEGELELWYRLFKYGPS